MPMTCNFESIQYGTVIFSGFVKSSLNKQNVFSEDNQSVKYIKCTLEVEFIVTRELIQFTGTRVYTGIDEEMNYIRQQLLTPNLQLKFRFRGAGTNVSVLGSPTYGPPANYEPSHPLEVPSNLFNGPFPEVLNWEPLGFNNAAKCRWRCNFFLSPNAVAEQSLPGDNLAVQTGKPVLGGRTIQDADLEKRSRYYAGRRSIEGIVNTYINTLYSTIVDPNGDTIPTTQTILNYLVSHTEEQEINIEEDGTVTASLIGTFEFSGGAQMSAVLSQPNAIPRLIQVLTHYFEPLHPPGFSRTQKYRYKKSRREVEYVITDKEMKTDNPLMQGIVKADVSHTVESSLMSDDYLAGSGFYTWNNTFAGSVTVAPGIWIGWAWIAMMTIVKQRMNRTSTFVAGTDVVDALKNEVDSARGPNPQAVIKGEKPRHLLHRISIKENIYNRQVDFSLNYLVTTSLANLFYNTGLFFPVHIAWGDNAPAFAYGLVPFDTKTPNPNAMSYARQWCDSNLALSQAQNVFGYRGPLLPGYNLIFNPNESLDVNRPGPANAVRNPEDCGGNNFSTGESAVCPRYISGGVGDGATSTFAYWRRAAHLEVFNDLNFSTPTSSHFVTPGGENNPAKAAPGAPAKTQNDVSNTSYFKNFSAFNSDYLKYTTPSNSWISYEPRFEISTVNNSVMFPTISSEHPERRHTGNPRPSASSRDYVGFTVNGSTMPSGGSSLGPSSSGYENSPIQAFGKPITYVRFSGKAVRSLFPVPTPTFAGCQNAYLDESASPFIKAYQVGASSWCHEQLNASSEIPIFCAAWDITYALQGDPTSASIGFRAAYKDEYLS